MPTKTSIKLGDQTVSIGQTVYLEPCGNFARRGHREIRPGIVKSFGRRYIHIQITEYASTKVDATTRISTEPGDCNAYYRLWLSQQEYEHNVERVNKEDAIESFIRNSSVKHLSDDSIWAIYAVLKSDGVLPKDNKN